MREDVESKIFDPFFSTKFAGRGMGLAVIKGIIHSHNGAINIVSAPGQGSRFEILLPCSNEPARKRHDKAGFSVVGEVVSSSGAVLIVEDERLSRKALAMLLGACGYETLAVGSAEEALSILSADVAPDFALVDVDLPGMSGLEFAEQLNRVRPDVFTVLITAAEGERIQKFLREHPVTYLRKPLDFDHLLGVLSSTHAH